MYLLHAIIKVVDIIDITKINVLPSRHRDVIFGLCPREDDSVWLYGEYIIIIVIIISVECFLIFGIQRKTIMLSHRKCLKILFKR